MSKVYEIVTKRVIEEMEKGIIPWARPWQEGLNKPVNWVTGKSYRGINRILLPSGEYATYNQITKAGGKVKKGEKSWIVTFWKLLEIKDEKTKEIETIPFLRYYRVFEISRQCEGLNSKWSKEIKAIEHNSIAEAERIIEGYRDRPLIREGTAAYYRPATDEVYIPNIKSFYKAEEYYKVLFHELIHSTGHKKRLNRSSIRQSSAFGSVEYSKEELIAELGASFLASEAGLNYSIENTVAYLQGWLKALQGNSKLIIQAASAAEKASEFILNEMKVNHY